MPATPPDEGQKRTISVLLILMAAIALITIGVLVYWSARGEPVKGPTAPQGEATVPGT